MTKEKCPPLPILQRRQRIRGRFLFDLIPGISQFSPTKAKQSFKDEADINIIMGKYVQTGHIVDPSIPRNRKPFYGDFSNVTGIYESKCRIAKAEEEFMLLPSKIRDKFENNLENLVAFLADAKNDAEAVEMGLKRPSLKATAPEAPQTQPKAENPSNAQPEAKETK